MGVDDQNFLFFSFLLFGAAGFLSPRRQHKRRDKMGKMYFSVLERLSSIVTGVHQWHESIFFVGNDGEPHLVMRRTVLDRDRRWQHVPLGNQQWMMVDARGVFDLENDDTILKDTSLGARLHFRENDEKAVSTAASTPSEWSSTENILTSSR